jgi:Tol biopolymer transport system component/DNA-binding winged helix-turn-helix (wHTH) protein
MSVVDSHSYRFGPYLLVTEERLLLCEGQRVPLTPKVFDILLVLVENANHVVSKETLLKRIWPDTVVQEDSLTFNISILRKILGSHANGQQFIQTEHKQGYRFITPVAIGPFAPGKEEMAPRVNGNESGLSAPAEAPPPTLSNGVRGKAFSLGHWAIWAAGGLALLAVLAVGWLTTPRHEPRIVKYDQLTTDGREKRGSVVTDGARVYFLEAAPTGWTLAQVSVSGGEPVPIASVSRDSDCADLSPDHRDLLVVEGKALGPGTLKVVPLLGGEPHPLGNIRAYSAAWSPDGASLAYTTDGGIFLCDPDGSNSRQIVSLSGQLVKLRWSPKGRKLYFTRAEHSGDSLYEVNSDGRGLICLSPGIISGPLSGDEVWSPNGEFLVAESTCRGHSMPVAVRAPSGLFGSHWGQPTCLGFGPLDLSVSAISPDGSRLFTMGREQGRPQMEEFDRQAREFRKFLPGVSARFADFSKDGQRIAYVTGIGDAMGGETLWISQADGSHKVQITKTPLEAQLPRWSPDGKWVAFIGKLPGQAWRVRVVSVEGGSYAPVTTISDEEGAPTWSPDGAQLAFGGIAVPPEKTRGKLVIHILNLKSGQISEVPGSEGLWTARWSPDGRYIAALTQDSRHLMLFDFRTNRWVQLASMNSIEDIVWSRHEAAVYINGEIGAGDFAIFHVQIPGGKVEQVASLNGRADSDWLGLTPEGAPLVAGVMVGQEVYAMTVEWP